MIPPEDKKALQQLAAEQALNDKLKKQLEGLANAFAAGYPGGPASQVFSPMGRALSLQDIEDAMESITGTTYSGKYNFFVAKDGTTIAEKVITDPVTEAPVRFYRTSEGWVKSGDPKKKIVTRRCNAHLNEQFEAHILKETVT